MKAEATLRRRDGVTEARISEREVVLLGPDAEDYLGLDPVAADVWDRLARPTTFGALVAALADDYDAAPERIAEDVAPMIEDLVAGGLVERGPGDDA
jgi:hypothetical protein